MFVVLPDQLVINTGDDKTFKLNQTNLQSKNDSYWLTKSLNQIVTLTLSRPCLRDLYSFFVNIGKSEVTG